MKKAILLFLFMICSSSYARPPEGIYRILVYASEDQWHAATLVNAKRAFEKMAEDHRLQLQWTTNKGFFSDAKTMPFDVLVFLHAKPIDFSEVDRLKFQHFIQNGGGFVGIHAVITHGEWKWFDQLIGREFIFHPQQQTAVVNVADKYHSSVLHLPENFLWTDEFYVFGSSKIEGLKTLLQVDTLTYDSVGEHQAMAHKAVVDLKYLPLAWIHEYDGGRVFYTALGHRPEHYNNQKFIDHIFGGICWAAGIAQKQ